MCAEGTLRIKKGACRYSEDVPKGYVGFLQGKVGKIGRKSWHDKQKKLAILVKKFYF